RSHPDHPEALHLLGVLAVQRAQPGRAVEFIEKAIRLNPTVAAYHNNLGEALRVQDQLDAAISAYHRALALQADYAEALNNLGLALQAQGKLDAAAAALRDALALAPDAETQCNLADVLREQGKLEEAIVAYRKALALKPDFVEAHNNLGAALTQHGRCSEAVVALRQALVFKPDYAEAHYNLGLALDEQGDAEQAIAAYERALTLKPEYAAAHRNMGIALHQQGKLEEAIAAYQRALALRFENDTLDNFARALFVQGQIEQAVEAYLRTLRTRPKDATARRGLVFLLRTARPTGFWAELEQELTTCFRSDDINHQQLAGITANQLKHKYALAKRLPLAEVDNRTFLDALADDQLLLALLTQTVNVDYELERFFIELRRNLLLTHYQAARLPEAHVALIGGLAQQCFNNEYVFNTDLEEARAVEQLKNIVCAQASGGEESLQSELENQLLLLSCYASLASLDCASKLATSNTMRWQPVLQTLIERTLIEPLQEQAIAKDIESLGEIDDPTSRAVRAQYEENPYPRWLGVGRSDRTDLASILRARFPHFKLPAFLNESMRVLVAGCGTGHEPISLALTCQNAAVVAVDLSRRSLAYATRMARKLGVTNVRFLQADILNLAQLGERFHIISSAGVLHHMADPLAGWRVLAERLVPAGLMQVTLYSEVARRPLTAAQEEIKRRGLKPVAEDIKSFRTLVLSGAINGELAELTEGSDFYSLSSCRDLLFHVKEHRFTLAQIREALATLDLALIGFDLQDLQIQQRYRERPRHDNDMTDFATWEQLEKLHPQAFLGMYRFWCQKL
ncbi:MAG: tetratricopeptide repeat protein, partial [Acidiferrobacterales bacterium]